MKRFLRDVLTPGSAGEYGRAEWALHWLLAAAIVLPLAIFATQHGMQRLDRERPVARLLLALGLGHGMFLRMFLRGV